MSRRFFLQNAYQCAAMLVVVLSSTFIVGTYSELSHTVDEPTHIAAGLEWVERGTQRLHAENPPLGRIGAGLGAWLAGYPLPGSGTAPQRGVDILYEDGRYETNLARARLATLPFFLLACLVVWRWTYRLGGPRAAFVATGAFSTLPPVLGHSGLATTDVPFLAAYLLALYAFDCWLETPTRRRALCLGLALGFVVAVKFSALVFLPPGMAAAILMRLTSKKQGSLEGVAPNAHPLRNRLLGAGLALFVAAIVVWAAYGFTLTTAGELPGAQRLLSVGFREDSSIRPAVEWMSARPMPAGDALYGLLFLKAHAVKGHAAYLRGERRQHGFRGFYPTALLVKTPITFLVLLGAALLALPATVRRLGWSSATPVLAAAALLLVSTRSTINIGVRHVLAIYPLLAISVGLGVDQLLARTETRRQRFVGVALGLLLAWQLGQVFSEHPDYLASFNRLAGDDPGAVLVDSDLDWGQDIPQLEEFFRDREADRLHIAYFGSVRLCEADLPRLEWLAPDRPVSGWVAVSEMYYRGHWNLVYDDVCDRTRARRFDGTRGYAWLGDLEPEAIAGSSIRIYRVPDD